MTDKRVALPARVALVAAARRSATISTVLVTALVVVAAAAALVVVVAAAAQEARQSLSITQARAPSVFQMTRPYPALQVPMAVMAELGAIRVRRAQVAKAAKEVG